MIIANRSVMLRSMLISGGLIAITLLGYFPYVFFGAALVPMIWYHLAYLTPRAARRELTALEVDSVYYYGFLLTVLALAASAITLAIRGVDQAALVGVQFGLGLFATGYAVAARMHLLTLTAIDEPGDEGDILDSYVLRARELISNVELASSSFEVYANSLQERASSAASQAQRNLETSISEATKAFSTGIDGALTEAKQSVTDLRALLNDAAFGSERAELKTSVQASLAAVTKFNAALEQLAALSSTSATAAGELTGALGSVSDNAGLVAERLGVLTAEEGPLANFHSQFVSSANEINRSTLELAATAEGLGTVTENAAAAGEQLSELKGALAATAKALRPLEVASDRVQQMAGAFEGVNQGLAAINDASSTVEQNLEQMAQALNVTLPLLKELGAVGEISAPTLQSMNSYVAQLEDLAATLAPIAQSMTGMSSVLQKHADQLEATVSANDNLLRSISSTVEAAPALQSSVSAIPGALEALEQAMSKTSANLAATAGSFETAASAAASSLKRTAETSAEYVEDMGRSFTGLAGFIIEKTRDRARSKSKD